MGMKTVTAESLGIWMDSAAQLFMELDTQFRVVFATSRFKSCFGVPTGNACFAHLREREEMCKGCPAAGFFAPSRSAPEPVPEIGGEEKEPRPCQAAVAIYGERGKVVGAAVLLAPALQPDDAEGIEWGFHAGKEAVLPQAPEITFTLDDSGSFVFVHSRASDLVGAPVDRILGTYFWDLVAPEQKELARTIVDTPPESIWEQDLEVLDADGAKNPVRLRCRASRDPLTKNKTFDGFIRARDVHARLVEHLRTYHEYLEESERRYRTLVEQLPDVVFSMDRYGRFIFLNSRIRQLLGYPVRKVIETYLWDYTCPESTELARSLVQLDAGHIWDEELWLLDCEGRKKWARIRCKPLVDLSGRVAGFEGVMRDRTARKMLEEELRSSKEELIEKMQIIDEMYEQMAESRKAKSIAQHTAQVAHELKQPLSIIGGFARRLARQVEPGRKMDLETQGECFRIMINEVQRLEKILGDLVNFARNETIRLKKTDPNSLVEEVLRVHEERLKELHIDLAVHLDRTAREVFLDPDRFQHVVRNLVANAIEASERGGLVRIETGVLSTEGEAEQTGTLRCTEHFVLKIANRGKIIPPEDIGKIFDPFYTTKSGGTGVGLTLVKKIVDEHRGVVTVKSDAAGTVFTVLIPRRATAVATGEEAEVLH